MSETTTPFNPATLIKQDAIDAVTRQLSHLRARHAEAVASVPQANAALDAAKRAHVATITTGGDVAASKRAVLDADADCRLASDVVDALTAEAARVQFEDLPRAQAEAHAALATYAFAELAATAARHDELEEQHAENDARTRAALWLVQQASSAGHTAARGYANGAGGLRPTERAPVASHTLAAETAMQGAN